MFKIIKKSINFFKIHTVFIQHQVINYIIDHDKYLIHFVKFEDIQYNIYFFIIPTYIIFYRSINIL